MAITKFTMSEEIKVAQEKDKRKISAFVKEAGKNSVEELTEDEKESLQKNLTR